MKTIQSTLILCLVFSACEMQKQTADEGLLIAEVYKSKLFLEDIKNNLTGLTKEDSAQMIRVLTEKWAREQIVIHAAEDEIGDVIAIEKLIEDYRSSLMIHNFEKVLVEQELDTSITDEALNQYYEENKSDYSLKTDIFRCILIKFTNDVPQLRSLNKWWEKDYMDKVAEHAEQLASLAILQDSSWYTAEHIAEVIPRQLFNVNRIKKDTKLKIEGDEFIYYFKVLDFIPKTEIAPISFIKEQARRVILHNRKIDLLADYKENLYQQAVNKNQINIYIE